jgi:hypothetical protein
MMSHARVLVATLWVGSLWTVGYVVAPVLFFELPDRTMAGTIAGQLFRIEAWLSIICSAILLASITFRPIVDSPRKRKFLLVIVCAMLLCTVIGYFGLQPFMAALREAVGPGGMMDPDARTKFDVLHGISALIYLFQSVLGIALILRIR